MGAASHMWLLSSGKTTFFFSFMFTSWRLITLQYYSGFAIHWHVSTMDLHVFPIPIPPPASLPIPSLWVFPVHQPRALVSCINLGWRSVSPLIVYLLQCYSLRTSHPCLLPQSPKVCSVHLCLFFCFAYWVIVTTFLNSIYMH